MAQYDPDRIRRQQEREAERLQRAAQAKVRERQRAEREAHIAARKAETQRINDSLTERIAALEGFLVSSLRGSGGFTLGSLRRTALPRPLQLGSLETSEAAPQWTDFAPPDEGLLKRVLAGRSARDARLQAAKDSFAEAEADHSAREVVRRDRINEERRRHAALVRDDQEIVDAYNSELSNLQQATMKRDKLAVEQFLGLVVQHLPAPTEFPLEAKIAYHPPDEHAVVEAELPPPGCIPKLKQAKYVQARDEITQVARLPREQADLYRRVVAQFCLLVIRQFLVSDPALRQVSFNGRVRHINPATGHEEYPHIISVIVERMAFESLVLDRVRPEECLRYLKALVSPHPFELEAVRPLVEFDKSRIAFIAGLDAVSSLDSRPDLMAMSPTEFEHLVRQILDADPNVISIESLTTRQSNDGGVDGVVYIHQALGRSMTVIQAKQYVPGSAIGPAHIRELIGAMHETKAGNGILVTTSRFTSTAVSSAAEFGRIQLIDGGNLVHMIKELLGKDVLIGDQRPRPFNSHPSP